MFFTSYHLSSYKAETTFTFLSMAKLYQCRQLLSVLARVREGSCFIVVIHGCHAELT